MSTHFFYLLLILITIALSFPFDFEEESIGCGYEYDKDHEKAEVINIYTSSSIIGSPIQSEKSKQLIVGKCLK
jgi:hypothetical protein